MIEQLLLRYKTKESLDLIYNYQDLILSAPLSWQNNESITEWRKLFRYLLYMKRNYRSDLSGIKIPLCMLQVHEGIIPRAVVPKNVSWSWMIHHEYNCFLLTAEEHIPNPPSRKQCYEISCKRYGKETIDNWISSLPFKSKFYL